MTAKLNLETLDLVFENAKSANRDDMIQCLLLGPRGVAMMTAQEHVEPFHAANANWRRIKREWRKGWKKGIAKAEALPPMRPRPEEGIWSMSGTIKG